MGGGGQEKCMPLQKALGLMGEFVSIKSIISILFKLFTDIFFKRLQIHSVR